ncbi:hypothetical protein, partial [Ralstonia pseudosolanacearum]|uniref:hypothetical protein n=1 Tax=Ralstonia pseudosolanacearum TaxID=1310165 RepID=UPI003CE6FB8E
PSRFMCSTCLTAETFVPLGFLSDLSRKWNIAMKFRPPFYQPTAGSRSDSDWHIFSAVFSRQDAAFLAFHVVKCISEHFRQNLLSLILAHAEKIVCTRFALFQGIP